MMSSTSFLCRSAAVTTIVILAAAAPLLALSAFAGCRGESISLEDGPVGVAQSAVGRNYCVTYDASTGCPDGSTVYGSLNEAAPNLQAGDIVYVIGGGPAYVQDVVFTNYADASSHDADDTVAACPSGGIPGKITVCGVSGPDGGLPILSGAAASVEFQGDHYLLENVEVTSQSTWPYNGGGGTCVHIMADDVTLRNVKVHNCAGTGIEGADYNQNRATHPAGAGSVTLDYVEVYAAGSGDNYHAIYMATDEVNFDGCRS
jgi:hypothetical protein